MWPKFSTNKDKVISLEDYEKGQVSTFEQKPPVSTSDSDDSEQEKRKILTHHIFVILFLLLLGTMMHFFGQNGVQGGVKAKKPSFLATADEKLHLVLIQFKSESESLTPSSYGYRFYPNHKVKVHLELNSGILHDKYFRSFYVRNVVTHLSEGLVPLAPPQTRHTVEDKRILWSAKNYVYLLAKVNDGNIISDLPPVTVDYIFEVSAVPEGPYQKVFWSRTFNMDTSNCCTFEKRGNSFVAIQKFRETLWEETEKDNAVSKNALQVDDPLVIV